MQPIEAQYLNPADKQWLDVHILAFVPIQGLALLGSDASSIHALFTYKEGDGKLRHSHIENFVVKEVK